jgi:hypothetical protein
MLPITHIALQLYLHRKVKAAMAKDFTWSIRTPTGREDNSLNVTGRNRIIRWLSQPEFMRVMHALCSQERSAGKSFCNPAGP